MIIAHKKQVYHRQFGHGIGDVLRNIFSNKFVQNGIKTIGKHLFPAGVDLIKRFLTNPEKIKRIADPQRLVRQIPKIIDKVADAGIRKLIKKENVDVAKESREVIDQLLYGEGVKRDSKPGTQGNALITKESKLILSRLINNT